MYPDFIEPYKILLFYKFTPLADPVAIRLWQKTLCEHLGVKGRIIISKDGINGTVGGPLTAVKLYRRATREFEAFKDIDFKWSEAPGEVFPRLSVKVREEIVTFGTPDEIKVDEGGIIGGGKHLTPHEVNELVKARGDEVVFFDGRNEFEARVGRFRNAVIPDAQRTPDFIRELESGKYDHLKERPVVTYCTGGIRCEVLSVLMKNRGFSEVYQIDGGIVRYAETFGESALWEGSLYVFDGRNTMDFSDDPTLLGSCEMCGEPAKDYYNCVNSNCRARLVVCPECSSEHDPVQCISCR